MITVNHCPCCAAVEVGSRVLQRGFADQREQTHFKTIEEPAEERGDQGGDSAFGRGRGGCGHGEKEVEANGSMSALLQ
jgi:hypothetical protein